MEIFGAHRPVIVNRVLNSAAGRPADLRFGEINRIGRAIVAEVGVHGVINVAICQSAGPVNQEPADRRNTDATANRSQPLNAFMREQESVGSIAGTGNIRKVKKLFMAFDVGSLEIGLQANDQPVPLIIITNLATTDEAGSAVTPRLVGKIVIIDIGVLGVAKSPAGIQTDVKSGPIALRQGRRRDLFHFFPTVRSRSGERVCQRDTGENDTHQVNSLFHGR